ncbi:MAG: hypothetical protein A3G46_00325 [Candidatus Zambryskibacteria bacterium RIFCSPLOWO2_12_FULL_39_16]|uniref:Uncharacterized protein n=1 Tax=Candidatus Zambryskibacteria bacterium RIFCSPLOWO2_12_FULL_39_16 TaxID=1802775 RepID=A0A1G2USA2_9BACT|nr:MAG: hypothetical protein A3I19_02235 [Candidatus Zambryskibacteria bacterium RIFCSPLOWO2_02_FULL_38_13]OHB12285.1 MAG: hypothetical protein A3G46_00325 [Candidatus Zambryskibacteria bacterium RIFCSPLOWO2_12_FULL_39_16]
MNEIRFNKPTMPPASAEVSTSGGKKDKPKIWQKMKKQNIFLAIMLLMIIILVGVSVNFYFKAENIQIGSQTATANEAQKIIEEVSKLIVLPNDEIPTMATIQDPTKLRSQPFFANAKEGDKVLIYTKAGKAILYDPVKKIIVEVAPLNNGTTN